jgi:hypothetical protein
MMRKARRKACGFCRVDIRLGRNLQQGRKRLGSTREYGWRRLDVREHAVSSSRCSATRMICSPVGCYREPAVHSKRAFIL